MGFLSVVKEDIEYLVQNGLSDKEIAKSMDLDYDVIKHIVLYFRKQYNIEFKNKINTITTSEK